MANVRRTGLIVAVLGLLSALSPASADIVYTNYSVLNDVNVNISCGAVADCTSGKYGSGRIEFYNNANLVAESWCIDVSHELLASGTFQITLAQQNGTMSNIRNDGGSNHGDFLSWNLLGQIGGLMKYGTEHIGDPNMSSAVQLAIWDLEYAGKGLTTLSDSAAVQSAAASLLNMVQLGQIDSYWGVVWLHYCDRDGRNCNQGQLMLVPEPSSLAATGSGLLILAGCFAYRRRRNSREASSELSPLTI